MAILLPRVNDALNINPPAGEQYLSTNGSNWLWAVTAVFVVSLLAFLALSFAARAGEKIFHYLFTIALFVGSISYFAMASDLGWSVVRTADNNPAYGATRQIFFAKYVYWVVAFPALIVALGLLSGVSWATIAYDVFLAWVWIVSYLVGAYTPTDYKWGFFVLGTLALGLLVFSSAFYGGRSARRAGVAARDHALLSGWLSFLWLLYPIAWGLSDGGNRIGVTAGFIFFGILDVLAVPLLGFAVLALARRWDYGRLNIAFTQYGRVRAPAGAFPEKAVAGAAPVAGVTGEAAV